MRVLLVFLVACAALRSAPLPSGIIDAQYNAVTGKLVMVSSDSKLYIYDPGSETYQTVSLSQVPLGVSLNPDGTFAAVLQGDLVTYVNLSSAAVSETFPTAVTSGSIVLSAAGIYAFPDSQGGPAYLVFAWGPPFGTANAVQAGSARFDAPLNAIYGVRSDVTPSNLFEIDVSNGYPGSITQGSGNGACGNPNLWLSADGSTIYTGCGKVFDASGMAAVGSLAGLGEVQGLSASATEIAAIPAAGSGPDTEVWLYARDDLSQEKRFVLPNGGHGKWVFLNQDGTAIYVIAEVGSSYELDTIDPTKVCTTGSFTSNSSASVAATGTLETAGVRSGSGCVLHATSNADWISLVSGDYGSGDATLAYVVRPNTSPQARSGTITLASGAALTISQAGWSGLSPGLVNLSVNPIAADYSKALDKLVYVSAEPNELHLYDPATQTDTFVSLALAPTSVSVDPSGTYAAVGHDGWISYVNLQASPMTVKLFPIVADVNDLVAGNDYVYAFPKLDLLHVFTLNTSNGTVTSWLDVAGGQIPRLDALGNALYVSGGEFSEWDLTQTPPVVSTPPVSTCGNLWLSEDATRIYTACANAYNAADFIQAGSLSMAGTVQWAVDSAKNHSLAVIPLHPPGTNGELIDSQLQIYSNADLSFTREEQLPSFQVNGASYTGHGKYAFWNGSGSDLVVVEQADSTAPLLSDFGVYVTSTCSYSVSPSLVPIAATGSSGTLSVAVSASNRCSWSAQSQASWIQITGGSGTGDGSVSFSVGMNSGPNPRTDTITVAGQSVTISQAAMPLAQVGTSRLAFGSEQTGTASSSQAVTFTNTSSVALSFSGIGISGSAASDFPIEGNTCGSALAGGASCTVTIAFLPTNNGTRTANLTFSDNASGSVQTVPLTGTGNPYLPVSSGSIGPTPRTGDFDGDGKSDLVVWRPSNGTWYVTPSSGGYIQQQWGLPGDIPVTGDFNGDKRTDFAVWRQSNGSWYVLFSNQAAQYPIPSMVQQWGLPSDIPVPGDYDGDGKTDFAVWRPSNGCWYVLLSTQIGQYPIPSMFRQWGLPGDIPVPGDYDGDGKTDFAVWRPSNGTWYIIPSSDPTHPIIQQWGLPGDIPVPADFDGDKRDDFAVWRPSEGNWYILTRSQANRYPVPTILQQWGLPGDLPEIGDFDGSGKASFAVLRPSNFIWFILNQSDVWRYPAPSTAVQWGIAGDFPM